MDVQEAHARAKYVFKLNFFYWNIYIYIYIVLNDEWDGIVVV